MNFPFYSPSIGELLLVSLLMTHITIVSVTLYLHRCCAHGSIQFHTGVKLFFRTWLWLTTGQVEREWVAVHRCHHAHADRKGDPHSPQQFGIAQLLFGGWFYYRRAASKPPIIRKYGYGCSDDWLEKQLFAKYSYLGVTLWLALLALAFGPLAGTSIWLIQMLWIPFWAAGVINGLAHWMGYRNYKLEDYSHNLIPWAFWIGGEELHNNHHFSPASAKFSHKAWEFDIGWMYIRLLSMIGLAQVRRLPDQLMIRQQPSSGYDRVALQAFVQHHVMIVTHFTQQVLMPVLKEEIKRLPKRGPRALRLKKLHRLAFLPDVHMPHKLPSFPRLNTVFGMKHELQKLGRIRNLSEVKLHEQLEKWCKQAEQSGIEVLHDFSLRLKSYALVCA